MRGDALRAHLDPWLVALARERPAYAELLAEEDLSLEGYGRRFRDARPPALQDRGDHAEALAVAAEASQGQEAATRVRRRMAESPLVFTANHLCLETLPLTVQSTLLAGLGEAPEGILPVEASALIPGDNASFPVGLLLGRREASRPLRLLLLDLSRRQRRQMTLLLPPYTAGDLDRAEAEVAQRAACGELRPAEAEGLFRMLREVLRAPDLLARPSFRAQAEAATPRLWDRWFTPEARAQMPPLAYAAFEAVRTELLIRDLETPGSPLHRLLLHPPVREAVLQALDGVPCCWTEGGRRGGSALLWEVTAEHRASPLVVEDGALRGATGSRFPLEAKALLEALREGRLLPTSFLGLALGLVRGLVQVGGFHQIDYLARMQQGLARAFASTGHADWARALAPGHAFLTAGLSAVAASFGDGEIEAAGGVELFAHGGLGPSALRRMRALTLREALALGEAANLPDPTRGNRLATARFPLLPC